MLQEFYQRKKWRINFTIIYLTNSWNKLLTIPSVDWYGDTKDSGYILQDPHSPANKFLLPLNWWHLFMKLCMPVVQVAAIKYHQGKMEVKRM